MKVALISPFAPSVPIFRGELIYTLAKKQGASVYVFAPDYTNALREAVRSKGGIPVDYSLDRTSLNPVKDLFTLYMLEKKFLQLKPQVILAYQPKPNIYATIAAWLVGVPRRFALVEGLGYVFTPGHDTFRKQAVRWMLQALYRFAFRGATKVFFLNPDDQRDFQDLGIVRKERCVLLGGIGVDLEKWPFIPPLLAPITFTMVARLLREKGVLEFVAAAKRVKARHPQVRFLLLGPLDTNPGAISERDVHRWIDEGILEWVPWTDNVLGYLSETSVFVLPSYREGIPRSTQEALAVGRPVITTDAPGCRETVVEGVNGFLVPPMDVLSLVEAMERFIEHPALIEKMGSESRKLAEERFDVHRFNEKLIKFMLE